MNYSIVFLLGANGGSNYDVTNPSIPGSVVSSDGEIFPLHHHVLTHR